MGTDSGVTHHGDVGRHFGNDRDGYRMLDIGGKEGHQLAILTHIAAHTCRAHLRAGEVQFYGIDTGCLGPLGQFNPFFFGRTHDGCHHDFGRIVLFQAVQDIKVHFRRILAQLLHIAQRIEVTLVALTVQDVKSGGHLVDVVQADGLVEDASPAGFKGACHHLIVGANR